ncbi:MAG: hypothetical protein L0G99_02635 [Propionibacteriales bacterium]|nr:hypothetical protein [Propionibacteriales bacterium]
MRDLIDLLADVGERVRHLTGRHWLLLLMITVGGVITLASLIVVDGFSPVLGLVAVVSLALTLLMPRGHVPTVFMISCVLWAVVATTAADLGWLVGVALGLLMVGWGCFLASLGPSYATVDRAVWRPVVLPLVGAVVLLVLVTAVVAVVLQVALPPMSAGLVVLLLVLAAALAAVLWPDTRARRL